MRLCTHWQAVTSWTSLQSMQLYTYLLARFFVEKGPSTFSSVICITSGECETVL